jgi:hypothetical protein
LILSQVRRPGDNVTSQEEGIIRKCIGAIKRGGLALGLDKESTLFLLEELLTHAFIDFEAFPTRSDFGTLSVKLQQRLLDPKRRNHAKRWVSKILEDVTNNEYSLSRLSQGVTVLQSTRTAESVLSEMHDCVNFVRHAEEFESEVLVHMKVAGDEWLRTHADKGEASFFIRKVETLSAGDAQILVSDRGNNAILQPLKTTLAIRELRELGRVRTLTIKHPHTLSADLAQALANEIALNATHQYRLMESKLTQCVARLSQHGKLDPVFAAANEFIIHAGLDKLCYLGLHDRESGIAVYFQDDRQIRRMIDNLKLSESTYLPPWRLMIDAIGNVMSDQYSVTSVAANSTAKASRLMWRDASRQYRDQHTALLAAEAAVFKEQDGAPAGGMSASVIAENGAKLSVVLYSVPRAADLVPKTISERLKLAENLSGKFIEGSQHAHDFIAKIRQLYSAKGEVD